MMKNPTKFIALLSGAALLSSSAFAQSVATAPVGYVSHTVNANADLKLGIPLMQAPAFSAAVDTVAAGVVTVAGAVPDVTTAAHFLWVSSGTLEGNWYTVTGSTANTITVAEDLATHGLLAADTFQVVPFWTLDTLFPEGGGIPQSADAFVNSGELQLSNLAGAGINLATGDAYIYCDGSQLATFGISEGWKNVNNPFTASLGADLITPESYITIRNATASPASITNVGTVPVFTLSNTILSTSTIAQDSQIANPFPADVLLASSGLIADGVIRPSPDAFNALDQLQIYPAAPTGINPAVAITYIYCDGSQLATFGISEGWKDINNPFSADLGLTDVIPAGAALVIRRSVGADELITWAPPVPYTLD